MHWKVTLALVAVCFVYIVIGGAVFSVLERPVGKTAVTGSDSLQKGFLGEMKIKYTRLHGGQCI